MTEVGELPRESLFLPKRRTPSRGSGRSGMPCARGRQAKARGASWNGPDPARRPGSGRVVEQLGER